MENFTIRFLRFVIRILENFTQFGLSIKEIKKARYLKSIGVHYSRYSLYNKKWLLDYNFRTIIDIGANIGEFTIIFAELFPFAKIYAFEPLPNCYKKLKVRTVNYPNINSYNFGLGIKADDLIINKSNWHPASSFRKMAELHKHQFPYSAVSEKIKVRVKSLDEILFNKNLKKDIFIKIDVQGFEDEVIIGGLKTIKQATVVVIEASFKRLYENEPMFHGIYSLLQPLGFEYRGSLKQSIQKEDDSYLQGDCVFVSQNN